MNKIYNNLNIENLIKTDWFNQFERKQRIAIKDGLKDNLDVLIYAKPEFDEYQMNQIKAGLKENLNVSVYAKKEFDWKQMEEIRKRLIKEAREKLENGQNT